MGWSARTTVITAVIAVAAAFGGAAVAQSVDPGPVDPPPAGAAPNAAPFYQPASEGSMVAVAPCRIVDTRKSGGAIAAGGTRSFFVAGATGFLPQGGTSGGCGVPAGAVAAALSVTTTGGSAEGYFAGYPTGQATSNGFVNITPGSNERASGTFALASGTGKGFTVKNASRGASHIVIDVQGYLVKPMAARVNFNGQAQNGTDRLLGSTKVATGVFEVQFDRNIRFCVASVTSPDPRYVTVATTWSDSDRPDVVEVRTYTQAGAPFDAYFDLNVTC